MLNRILGLWRDAWWLILPMLAGSAALGWITAPVVGFALPLVICVVFVYFAILRYDDDGRQRGSR